MYQFADIFNIDNHIVLSLSKYMKSRMVDRLGVTRTIEFPEKYSTFKLQ